MTNDPSSFRLALVQMAMTDDAAVNVGTASDRIRAAAAAGADVVCLPELFRTPYFCQREDPRHFDLAEPVPGPSTDTLGALARELGIVVIVPLFERRAPGIHHNTVAVIDADGRLVGLYRKMHIPDDPGFQEKYYFTPGDLGFRAVSTRAGRIGVLICWDQWFPEAARLVAMQGADVVVVPTAIGWHPCERKTIGDAQRDAWVTVQRGHAIANGVHWAAVNRVGRERPDRNGEGLQFWGSSFVSDPFGGILAMAPDDREDLLVVEIDRRRQDEIRRTWPFWRDRRIDAFSGLDRRWGTGGGEGAPGL